MITLQSLAYSSICLPLTWPSLGAIVGDVVGKKPKDGGNKALNEVSFITITGLEPSGNHTLRRSYRSGQRTWIECALQAAVERVTKA